MHPIWVLRASTFALRQLRLMLSHSYCGKTNLDGRKCAECRIRRHARGPSYANRGIGGRTKQQTFRDKQATGTKTFVNVQLPGISLVLVRRQGDTFLSERGDVVLRTNCHVWKRAETNIRSDSRHGSAV